MSRGRFLIAAVVLAAAGVVLTLGVVLVYRQMGVSWKESAEAAVSCIARAHLCSEERRLSSFAPAMSVSPSGCASAASCLVGQVLAEEPFDDMEADRRLMATMFRRLAERTDAQEGAGWVDVSMQFNQAARESGLDLRLGPGAWGGFLVYRARQFACAKAPEDSDPIRPLESWRLMVPPECFRLPRDSSSLEGGDHAQLGPASRPFVQVLVPVALGLSSSEVETWLGLGSGGAGLADAAGREVLEYSGLGDKENGHILQLIWGRYSIYEELRANLGTGLLCPMSDGLDWFANDVALSQLADGLETGSVVLSQADQERLWLLNHLSEELREPSIASNLDSIVEALAAVEAGRRCGSMAAGSALDVVEGFRPDRPSAKEVSLADESADRELWLWVQRFSEFPSMPSYLASVVLWWALREDDSSRTRASRCLLAMVAGGSSEHWKGSLCVMSTLVGLPPDVVVSALGVPPQQWSAIVSSRYGESLKAPRR